MEMDMYDRLERLLSEKKISKRKLSMDLNIPYTTLVSMFKRRSTSVDIETIKKLAKYLQTDIDFLVSGDYYPTALKNGSKIKNLRIRENLSQEELAKRAGYTTKEIREIEENIRDITTSECVELAGYITGHGSDVLIDDDLQNLSTPIDKNYVIIYSKLSFSKFYMTDKQIETVYNIAKEFGDFYNKENGIEGIF